MDLHATDGIHAHEALPLGVDVNGLDKHRAKTIDGISVVSKVSGTPVLGPSPLTTESLSAHDVLDWRSSLA